MTQQPKSSSPNVAHILNARVRFGKDDIRTVDVSIANGRIAAIADAGELQTTDAAETIDAAGAVLHPGFVDAHMHLLLGGEGLARLDLSAIDSREAFETAIAKHAGQLPAGEWLIAHGWNQDNWQGKSLPDRSWLAAAGERPAVAYRQDHHVCVVNDAVLAMLADANEPKGGRILRDAQGKPNGLFLEQAAWRLVNPLIPTPPIATRQSALRDGLAHCSALGLVAVGSMEYRADIESVFEPVRSSLPLRVRVTLLDRDDPLDDAFAFAQQFNNDDKLAIIGFKSFIDGTLGSRTAALHAPYCDAPEAGCGMLVEHAERGDLTKWIKAVNAHGFSASMHAIGDRALTEALDAAESLPQHDRARVRFEHAQTVPRADLPRLAVGFASVQPLHKATDAVDAAARLGASRMGSFFPFRAMADAGASIAFGSDWPIVSCDPFAAIRAAVAGRDLEGNLIEPASNLLIEEAIRAATTTARRCLGLDGGEIAVGEPADLVLLDRDPVAVDWHCDAAPTVLATIVHGTLRHKCG